MSPSAGRPPPRLKVRPWVRSELIKLENAPTADELRRHPWTKLHQGVVVWGDQDLTSPYLRVQAAAAALKNDVPIGGWAAAFMHGARDFDGGRGVGRLEPISFCPGVNGSKRPRPGLVSMRGRIAEEDVQVVNGVLCTSPTRTAFDLARAAPTLADAVASVDALLRAKPQCLTKEEFADYVTRQKGYKGIAQARAAVPLLSPLARSRPESALRVIWVVVAGLPMPLVNPKVFHRVTGRLLGLPDVLDAESGLVGEYDGAQHRDLQNHSDDNIREEAFEDAGLTVVRVTAVDFRRPEQLVRRLQAGYARARRNPIRNWTLGS